MASFATFLATGTLEPYQARGSAQVTYRGSSESGELALQAEPGPRFRTQLRARITGSLALDARFDETDLLIIDYAHESYLVGTNGRETRREQFSLDFSPLDFQMAVTGRVPESLFRAGGGILSGTQARFAAAGAEYRFMLDATGLPAEWSKWEGGVLVARVEYRSYTEYPHSAGAAVRLPERVRVYATDPRPRLILGLRDWHIGPDPAPAPISFVPPQDVLDRFHPQ